MDEEDMYSSSDDEFEDDKILLDEEEGKLQHDANNKDVVYGFDDDEGEEDGEGGGGGSDLDMDSDLEEEGDNLPSDKAWGQKRKMYYNTDYVDKDFSTVTAEETEAMEMEEQEARNIQKRLLEQLDDADFRLPGVDLTSVSNKIETVEKDLSSLTKRQKLELFRKESPEFEYLVQDFHDKLREAKERIIPVFELVKEDKLSNSSAVDFLKMKYRLILNYCTNIVFYVMLKTKRLAVKDHPVMKALTQYRQLLVQLQPIEENQVNPQLDKILDVFVHSKEEETEASKEQAVKTKKLLRVLQKPKKVEKKVVAKMAVPQESEDFIPLLAEKETAEEDDNEVDEDVEQKKRAITYEMAKNKGLTPKRSKEQRNPRVKHRNKFRKALIRRRGQVRTPRKEIPVYGGEPTGIKIGLKKGRKFT